jgi:hypothetical protein
MIYLCHGPAQYFYELARSQGFAFHVKYVQYTQSAIAIVPLKLP